MRKGKKWLAFLLCIALTFSVVPSTAFAETKEKASGGLCEHHTEHSSECGYLEGTDCSHEHSDGCYTLEESCVHEHTEKCYPTEDGGGVLGNEAAGSDTAQADPTECTHVCSEDNGCITEKLDCPHEKGEHDDACGYVEAKPCTYECEKCEEGSSEATEPEEESSEQAESEAECSCTEACTEDSVNADCPVCGVEDADLSKCEGEQQDEDQVVSVQKMIDALPTVDELTDMDEEEQREVCDRLQEAYDAYEALSEEQREEITGAEIFESLFNFFNGMANTLAGETGDFTVTGDASNYSYDSDAHTLTITGSGEVTISGATTTDKIVVASGVTANITLSGLSIDVSSTEYACAIEVLGKANITLSGENSLKSGEDRAGLEVPAGATLLIAEESTGSLIAQGGDDGAGIGTRSSSPYDSNTGNITISGGTVIANGGILGAGIGGGAESSGGNITISGGTVTANGGTASAAGIGGGDNEGGDRYGGNGGNITISGGTVTANGGIGGGGFGGLRGESGSFSTTDAGNAFIVASSIQDNEDRATEWHGVIFGGEDDKNIGMVYGISCELTTDAEIPEGKVLFVGTGKTISLAAGVTLTNNGTINWAQGASIPENIGGTTVEYPYYIYGDLLIEADKTAGTGLSYADGALTINTTVPVKILTDVNTAGTRIIVAASGANITLKDVTIAPYGVPITIQENVSATLALSGENVLQGTHGQGARAEGEKAKGKSGIQILKNASLSITGEGSLSVSGGNGGHAGMWKPTYNHNDWITGGDGGVGVQNDGTLNISAKKVSITGGKGGNSDCNGGGWGLPGGGGGAAIAGSSGSVVISKGQVSVTGGNAGASGRSNGAVEGRAGADGIIAQSVTVTGGTVAVQGGVGAASVNNGKGGKGGSGISAAATITGGYVTTKGGAGGNGSPKGENGTGFGAALSTGNSGGKAVIFTDRLPDGQTTDGLSGVIFQEKEGQVYGTPQVTEDFEVPGDFTLTIPDTSNLEIQGILTNRGTITGEGTLTNNGVINNYGTIDCRMTGNGVLNNASQVTVSFTDASDNSLSNNTTTYGSAIKIVATMKAAPRANTFSTEADDTVKFYLGGTGGILLGEVSATGSTATLTMEKNVWEKERVSWTIGGSGNTITADFGGSDSLHLLESTGQGKLIVSKADQDPPSAPIQSGTATTNTITLNEISPAEDAHGAVQYGYTTAGGSTDNINWTSNTTFSGLTVSTGYTFYARYAGDKYYQPAVSVGTTLYTAAAEPNVTINYTDETLSTDANMEYSINGGTTWANCTSGMAATAFDWNGTSSKTVKFRVRAVSGGAPESAAQEITIPARPSAPDTIQGSNETIAGKNDGKIIGLTAGTVYQISSDTGANWTDKTPTGTEITNLPVGDYLVRIKAVATGDTPAFASVAARVKIDHGETPTYILNITAPTFDPVLYGDAQPVAKAITISSTGNSDSTISGVALSDGDADSFTLNKTDGSIISAGTTDSTTYTVQPKAGLGAGSYTATITVTYNNSATATATVTFVVNPAEQAAPAAPELESKTTSSITLKAIAPNANGAAVEYRMNGGAWQTSPVFNGLSSNTSYTFEARYEAIENYEASPVSPAVRFTTESSGGAVTSNTVDDVQSKHTIEAVSAKDNPNTGVDNPFTDVRPNDWFYGYVMYAYHNGLMNGTSATTFSPYGTTTRAQLAVIFYRMDGSPAMDSKNSFTDVPYGPETEWYYDAVTWAQKNGILAGYEDGTFRPNNPITREQLAVVFYNYAKFKDYSITANDDLSAFTDAGKIYAWAQEAMKWAVGSGLMNGKGDGTINPKGTATRAEVAIMLHKFIENNELIPPTVVPGGDGGTGVTGSGGWTQRTTSSQTGDSSNIGLWFFLLLASLASLVVLTRISQRK